MRRWKACALGLIGLALPACRPPPAVLCTRDVGIRVTDSTTGAPVPRPDGRYVVTVGEPFDLVVSTGGLTLTPRFLHGPSGFDADVFAGEAIAPLHLRLVGRRPTGLVSYAWAFDDRGFEACRDTADFTIVAASPDAGVDTVADR